MPGTGTGRPLPRWARIADVVTLLILLGAVCIALTGGARARIGDLRLTLTSPWRGFVWALVVTFLRHVFARRPTIVVALPADLAAWARSAPSRAAAMVCVGTRPAIFLVGLLAVFLIGYAPAKAPNRDFQNEIANLPSRWDAGWYLSIAMHGYEASTEPQAGVQQNIVFFPALPMAIRVTAWLLGNSTAAYYISGTLVSLLAFFGALAYLYAFARDELDADRALSALWMLAAYPFALFYGAIYTEGLFLLGAVGAFYHFRRRELGRAAWWGFVVGLTRPNGCFLSIPLAVLAVSPWLPAAVVGGRRTGARTTTVRECVWSLAAAATPGLGVLVYSAYIWSLTGDPFAWVEGHAAWGRHYQGLLVLLTDRFTFVSSQGVYGYLKGVPLDFLNALGVIFALASIWPVARRLGLAYAVFILVNMLPPLAAGGFLSAGRFSSVMFPAFIWLASVVPERHRSGWIAVFAALQAFNATLFYTWRLLY